MGIGGGVAELWGRGGGDGRRSRECLEKAFKSRLYVFEFWDSFLAMVVVWGVLTACFFWGVDFFSGDLLGARFAEKLDKIEVLG